MFQSVLNRVLGDSGGVSVIMRNAVTVSFQTAFQLLRVKNARGVGSDQQSIFTIGFVFPCLVVWFLLLFVFVPLGAGDVAITMEGTWPKGRFDVKDLYCLSSRGVVARVLFGGGRRGWGGWGGWGGGGYV